VGYLGAGFVLLAVLGGTGGGASGSCPAAPVVAATSPAASQSPSPSTSTSASAMAAPASLSPSPVLTQQPSGTWTTTIYLNTAALCPAQPSFELVTTSPNLAVLGSPEYYPQPDCDTPMSAANAAYSGTAHFRPL
jgi:hypothetical protein